MVLEATLICLDNSECSRNGDYLPSRLEAQRDAANLICGSKTAQNPESAVGLLTSAGDRVQVRVAPTQDVGKMLQGLHEIPVEGESDIIRAVQTAQLALKHRMNKNQRQRIVLFVGSPISASEKQLELLGRTLKKNNVSLDIVSFGEVDQNSARLHKLHNAVNSNNTSHLIECPVDASRLLSDILMSTPLIRDIESEQAGGEPSVINELGVDPTTDPELYMALQLSLQEERSRQAALAARQGSATGSEAGQSGTGTVVEAIPSSSLMEQTTAAEIEAMEGIDDELRQALLLSINDFQPPEPQNEAVPDRNLNFSSIESFEIANGDDMTILPPAEAANPVGSDAAREATAQEVAEAATTLLQQSTESSSLHQIIGTLPGIDMNDPRLLEALQQVVGGKEKKDDGTQDEEKDEKH